MNVSLSLSLLRDEIQSDIIQFLIQFFFYREENSFIFDSQQQNFEFEITKSFSKLIFLWSDKKKVLGNKNWRDSTT